MRVDPASLTLLSPVVRCPDLSFAWAFNDSPLHVQEDSRRFVSQETGNLYIAKVEPSDVGNYTCSVTNERAQRSVRGPPTPLVQRPDGKTRGGLGKAPSPWREAWGGLCASCLPQGQGIHLMQEPRVNSQR